MNNLCYSYSVGEILLISGKVNLVMFSIPEAHLHHSILIINELRFDLLILTLTC